MAITLDPETGQIRDRTMGMVLPDDVRTLRCRVCDAELGAAFAVDLAHANPLTCIARSFAAMVEMLDEVANALRDSDG